MARRKRTLPIASPSGKEKTKSIAITRSGWRNVEKVFGKPLPQPTRDEILTLTKDFVYWAQNDGIYKLPKSGGEKSKVFAAPENELRVEDVHHGDLSTEDFAQPRWLENASDCEIFFALRGE